MAPVRQKTRGAGGTAACSRLWYNTVPAAKNTAGRKTSAFPFQRFDTSELDFMPVRGRH